MKQNKNPLECEDKNIFLYSTILCVFALIFCIIIFYFLTLSKNSLENEGVKLEVPKSGTVFYPFEYTEDYVTKLHVETKGSGYYYLKLRDINTKKDTVIFFVKGGEKETVKVKIGEYELLYAHGDNWYGTEDLFGENTELYKANRVFDFIEEDGAFTEWTVELYLQDNGNLTTSSISEDEF